jgi:hypothetical protein
MWMTLNLLVTRECRKAPRDLLEEIEEWLESVTTSARVDPRDGNDDVVRADSGTPTSEGVPDLPREKKKKKTGQNVKSSLQLAGCR